MTAVLENLNNRIDSAVKTVTADKKRAFIAGMVVYTVFFALFFSMTLLRSLLEYGSVLGGDSVSQYYPFLFEFRRNVGAFFSGLANGSSVFIMAEPNYAFGSDALTCVTADFLPFLPYYIFTPLIPEEGLMLYYGIGTVLMAYIAGTAFVYMCSYFEQSTLAAGFFAVLYIFCGSCWFTILFNQQFIYMLIALPLMIVGIDKIIRDRGFVQFVLVTGWLALGGTALLIYTLPFVVVFAAIRVFFVYKSAPFANLGKYFLRGAGAAILGICMAGFLLLPGVSELLTGTRLTTGSQVFSAEMLIPDFEYLIYTFNPNDMYDETAVCSAVIPFTILLLSRRSRTAEKKTYMLVMMLLMALPVIWYGLNAFRYELVRWGFVPALLMSYVCVSELRSFAEADKRSIISFIGVLALYLFMVFIREKTASVVLPFVVGMLTAVPLFRRLTDLLIARVIRPAVSAVKTHAVLRYAVIIVVAVAALTVAVFMIFRRYNYIISLIIVCLLVPAAYVLHSKKKEWRRLTQAVLSVGLVVSAVLYYSVSYRMGFYPNEIAEPRARALDKIAELSAADNTSFGRFWANHEYYDNISNDFEDDEEDSASENEKNDQPRKIVPATATECVDYAFMGNVPDIGIFNSVMNGDYLKFLSRCGQDGTSMVSNVFVNGFSRKEVLHSLFGVRYLYAPYEIGNIYGADRIDLGSDVAEDVYLYENRYALPAGVTYSGTMSRERYDSFDMATLPYAVMNEVYLAGAPEGLGTPDSDKQYSFRCDITHEKVSRGSQKNYSEAYDNTVTIRDDVSDCFLYLSFENVRVFSVVSWDRMPMNIITDTGDEITAQVHNSNSNFEWAYAADKYCIALGYQEKDVDTLTFITPFEYETMYVTAVPAGVYTGAYEKLTAEAAENVRLSPNALDCDINVSEDKVLCINLMYSKGWKAFVDGEQAPVYKANELFLGIPLKAGAHKIRLEYTTPLLFEGTLLSLAAIAVFVVLLIVGRRRKKRAAAAQ
ncbi:MAG: YfhO family protein [Ruminiclostridium sp.]|nr:YfhO family protein [Ruminiclostridium sp.]